MTNDRPGPWALVDLSPMSDDLAKTLRWRLCWARRVFQLVGQIRDVMGDVRWVEVVMTLEDSFWSALPECEQ